MSPHIKQEYGAILISSAVKLQQHNIWNYYDWE